MSLLRGLQSGNDGQSQTLFPEVLGGDLQESFLNTYGFASISSLLAQIRNCIQNHFRIRSACQQIILRKEENWSLVI